MLDPEARRTIDPVALAHQMRRLQRIGEAPWLHGEVARRMAERLSVIRLQPVRVLDWQAQRSASAALLHGHYPKAAITRVGVEAPATTTGRRWWPFGRGPAVPVAQAAADVPAASAELLWANMVLHTAADPLALFKRWHEVTAVGGFVMFSTLGPGSLVELSALYRRHGWPPPLAPFVDMHDLGDMLIEAGFADPVMDQETLTLTWPDPKALLTELRGLGGNTHPARQAGLRTPAWRERLCAALAAETTKADGRPSLSFEVVFGHAFRVAPKIAVAAETRFSADALQAMARGTARVPGTGRAGGRSDERP